MTGFFYFIFFYIIKSSYLNYYSTTLKQSIILWFAAFIITFLTGFVQNRLSGSYPISGSIGLEGNKITYAFQKVSKGNENFPVSFFSDTDSISAWLHWEIADGNYNWNRREMVYSDGMYISNIPLQPAKTNVKYFVEINYKNTKIILPSAKKTVNLIFLREAPKVINFFFYFFLFGGLVLSIKTGLEYFNDTPRMRLYSLFTVIFFLMAALLFGPVKATYEFNSINSTAISAGELFNFRLISLCVLWIIGMLFIFNSKKKFYCLITSAITILIFIFL